MNSIDLVELGQSFQERFDRPTELFQDEQHTIYWLGTPEDSAFRCNTYLIKDEKEAIIIDPGGKPGFEFIKRRISQILPPKEVSAMILSHQDPDVGGSMVDLLDLNPKMKVITSIRTNVLLPHYGRLDYTFYNINEELVYYFKTGHTLRFVPCPFLHFPGAFATYDEISGFLFSGDIWAAMDMDWKLVVVDFGYHELKLNLFHVDYMASNIAARGFINRIRGIELNAILPQHGSMIPKKFIPRAIAYLDGLKCGLDLIYPDLRLK